jgi:hypothetical protein
MGLYSLKRNSMETSTRKLETRRIPSTNNTKSLSLGRLLSNICQSFGGLPVTVKPKISKPKKTDDTVSFAVKKEGVPGGLSGIIYAKEGGAIVVDGVTIFLRKEDSPRVRKFFWVASIAIGIAISETVILAFLVWSSEQVKPTPCPNQPATEAPSAGSVAPPKAIGPVPGNPPPLSPLAPKPVPPPAQPRPNGSQLPVPPIAIPRNFQNSLPYPPPPSK